MVSASTVKAGLSWQSLSLSLQVTLQLLVLGLLARVLEPQAFGLVAAANITIDMCQLLSEAGASAAVIHRAQLDRDFVGTAWSTSIVIGAFLFLVLVLASETIAALLSMADIQPVVIALGGVFVLMGVARVPEALLQRDFRFAALMKINLGAQVFGYVLPAIVLALLGYGVWALVVGTLLQWVIKAGLLFIVTYRSYVPCYSRVALREMLSFGLGVTKEKIWNYIIGQGDRFIIGRDLGAEPLGQYHVMAVALLPSRYFGDVMDNVFFPVMARMRDDRERLIGTWLDLVSNSFVFMLAIGVFLAVNGKAIVCLAFGERWLESVPVFQILCLGTGFVIVTRLSDALNRALGQVHQTARRKMFNAVIFVPVVWFGAGYGLTGICVAVVSMQLLNALFQCQLAWVGLNISGRHVRRVAVRVLSGAVLIVVVNGIVLGAATYIQIKAWQHLFVAMVINVLAGAAFFWPLMKLWRSSGRSPENGIHNVP